MMRLFWINYTFILVIIFSLIQCHRERVTREIIHDPVLLKNLYHVASDTIYMNSGRYTITAGLWRDFMPGVTNSLIGKEHKLEAVISLFNTDSTSVPGNIIISSIYVINSDQIWQSIPRKLDDISLPSYLTQWGTADGPEWDIGIMVDIIAEMKDTGNPDSYFLIARNVTIIKTE